MKTRNSYWMASVMGLSLLPIGFGEITWAQGESFWKNIYQRFFAGQPPVPPTSGTGRGDGEICIVSPGSWKIDQVALLERRPLLVWQGKGKQIVMKNDRTEQVIWSQDITEPSSEQQINKMQYSGPVLQAGEIYRLQIEQMDGVKKMSRVQVLPLVERVAIEKTWLKIQEQALKEGIMGEALRKKRIQFLTERKLWLDIVHEIFLSQTTTPDWQQLQQGIIRETCDDKKK